MWPFFSIPPFNIRREASSTNHIVRTSARPCSNASLSSWCYSIYLFLYSLTCLLLNHALSYFSLILYAYSPYKTLPNAILGNVTSSGCYNMLRIYRFIEPIWTPTKTQKVLARYIQIVSIFLQNLFKIDSPSSFFDMLSAKPRPKPD